MKRIGLLLLAVVMVVGMAGCSKDEDKDFDFNGTWLMQTQLVSQTGNWELPGGRVQIVQDGTNLTWAWIDRSSGSVAGSCDPSNESLYIHYTTASGGDGVINGLAVDADTITGTMTGRQGGNSLLANFTLELISR